MTNSWPQANEGRIPTKNQMGFMFLEIHGASKEFLQDAKTFKDKVVDVGAAYGVVSLPLLAQSTCQLVAFDLAKEHLDILKSAVPAESAQRLTTIQGRFPEDFNFAENSLDAIHSSFMMHFLTSAELENGLVKCFCALKPGGKIYINVMSPYFKPVRGVLEIYERNAAKGMRSPGEIYDFKNYIPTQDIPFAPDFGHFFKKEEMEKELTRAGFALDKSFYYDLHEPEWFASDGKGKVAVVGRKA